MSSILEALKKLEKEFPGQSQFRFRPQKKRITQAIYQRVKVPRFSIVGFFIIFSLMVLAGAGWLISKRQYGNKKPQFIVTREIKIEKAIGNSKKRHATEPSPQTEVTSPMNNEISEPVSQAGKGPSVSARKDKEKIFSPDKITKLKAAKPLNIDEKTSSPDLPQKESPNRKTNEKYEPIKKSKKIGSIPVKQAGESGLQLQAIAWSGDPQSRLAVINGKIVREGGSVAGVHVMRIRKDDVVFKQGKEAWRQSLGFK